MSDFRFDDAEKRIEKLREKLEKKLLKRSKSFDNRMDDFGQRMEKFGDNLTHSMDDIFEGVDNVFDSVNISGNSKIVIDGVDVTEKYKSKKKKPMSMSHEQRKLIAIRNVLLFGLFGILFMALVVLISNLSSDKYDNKSLTTTPTKTIEQPINKSDDNRL